MSGLPSGAFPQAISQGIQGFNNAYNDATTATADSNDKKEMTTQLATHVQGLVKAFGQIANPQG
jgi:hypothetical protein